MGAAAEGFGGERKDRIGGDARRRRCDSDAAVLQALGGGLAGAAREPEEGRRSEILHAAREGRAQGADAGGGLRRGSGEYAGLFRTRGPTAAGGIRSDEPKNTDALSRHRAAAAAGQEQARRMVPISSKETPTWQRRLMSHSAGCVSQTY